MKKFWCIFLLMGLGSLHAGEHEDLFEQANAYFMQQHYDSAFYVYEGLVREEITDAALFCNFANTHYKLGDKAAALAWYERAVALAPEAEEFRNNLMALKAELYFEEEEMAAIFAWLRKPGTALPVLIGLFWVTLFSITIGMLFLRKRGRYAALGIGSLAFVLTIVVAWQAYVGMQERKAGSRGVALSEAIMYASPATVAEEVFEISGGQAVRVLEKDGQWLLVDTESRRKGWVHGSALLVW